MSKCAPHNRAFHLRSVSCFMILLCCVPIVHASTAPGMDIEYSVDEGERMLSLVLNLSTVGVGSTCAYYGHRLDARPDDSPCCPAVPRYSLYLAIPWDATPTLATVETIPGESVAATLPMNKKPTAWVDQAAMVRVDEAPCESSMVPLFFPESPVRIRTVGVLRDYKLLLLDLFVGGYDVEQRRLQRYSAIKVGIALGPGTFESKNVEETNETPPFQALYQSQIANLADARRLGFAKGDSATPYAAEITQILAPLSSDAPSRLRVDVDQDGLFVLDYERLTAAGMQLDHVNPSSIAMETRGHEIAVLVEGAEDGRFDPTDRILFYGQAPDEPYALTSPYYVFLGDTKGKRMSTRDVSPTGTEEYLESFQASVFSEENYFYFPNPPEHELRDHWFYEVFYPGDAYTYGLDLHAVVTEGGIATLRASLFGASDLAWVDPDHHLQFKLGEVLVEDVWWDGQQFFEVLAQFPAEWLYDGTNFHHLEIVEPGDTGDELDLVYLNWFELTYPARFYAKHGVLNARVEFPDEGGRFHASEFDDPGVIALDVLDPLDPVFLTGLTVEEQVDCYSAELGDAGGEHHYLLASEQGLKTPSTLHRIDAADLKSSTPGADLLIVTHGDFIEGIQPLVLQRKAEGLRVAVIDIADVFESFGHGIPTPWAIRDFVEHTMNHWIPPAPSYLLLVGDATLDTMGYLSDLPDNVNFVPTYHLDDELMGQVATDLWFAAILGDDPLPDLFVGRIPADSMDELNAYISKVVAYESFGEPAGWTRRALVVVDDGFIPEASNVSSGFADYLCSNDVFLDDFLSLSWRVDDVIEAIADGFNAGVALAVFFGHGGHSNWTHEGIWRYQHLELLDHDPAYPFLATLTCLNGYFDNPWSDEVLAEGFLTHPKGGAIGVLAPTREVSPSNLEALGRGLVKAIYQSGVRGIGPGAEAARLSLLAEYSMAGTVAAMSTLFGDPSLRLRVPTREDVDGSGRVDGGDLITVSRHMDSPVAAECDSSWNADIDLSDSVTDSDVQFLRELFGEVSK